MTSPVYAEQAHAPVTCPRCGRVFEAPFTVEGVSVAGHPGGDPKLCVPIPHSPVLERDARRRREGRRGQ